MNAVIERRVDDLEGLMAELIKAGKEAEERNKQANERSKQADERSKQADERSKQADERSKQADERSKQADERLAAYIARSEQEMREFKNEMRTLSAQTDERLKVHIAHSEQQLDKLSKEVQTMTHNVEKVSRDIKNTIKDTNKKMGETSNKIGRLVEDAVHPGIPKIFTEITGLDEAEITDSSIRTKRKVPNEREFDAVIVGGGYVLINETKSTLKPEEVKEFHKVMQEKIRVYFPEYADKKFIGVVSSLYVDESIVKQGSKLGLYVLGFKEDLMDVLNPEDFKPTYF